MGKMHTEVKRNHGAKFPCLMLIIEKGEPVPVDSKESLIIIDDLPFEIPERKLNVLLEDAKSGHPIVLIITDPCGYRSYTDDPALRSIAKRIDVCHIQYN